MGEGRRLDVVIVGGSCGGLACAHALLKTERCNVTVLERASSISAAGAVRRHLTSLHLSTEMLCPFE